MAQSPLEAVVQDSVTSPAQGVNDAGPSSLTDGEPPTKRAKLAGDDTQSIGSRVKVPGIALIKEELRTPPWCGFW